jgi:RNA polymerase sigma-70 factor (ECF subfamily)
VRIDPRFERLFREEYTRVYRAVYLLCRDREIAQDATQEAFARCLARWERLADRPWVAGWLTTTGMNVARRAMRRRPEPQIPSPAVAPTTEEALDLHRAMRLLPARQQEAVVLYYGLDLPVEDVASAMGCRPGTVKAHLSKARAALAGTLQEDSIER